MDGKVLGDRRRRKLRTVATGRPRRPRGRSGHAEAAGSRETCKLSVLTKIAKTLKVRTDLLRVDRPDAVFDLPIESWPRDHLVLNVPMASDQRPTVTKSIRSAFSGIHGMNITVHLCAWWLNLKAWRALLRGEHEACAPWDEEEYLEFAEHMVAALRIIIAPRSGAAGLASDGIDTLFDLLNSRLPRAPKGGTQ